MPAQDFRSDNVSGAHPAVLEALVAANQGPAAAYGDDAWTARLARHFAEIFEREVTVLPVATDGASPADLTWRAGVDLLSFGATKNGCLSAEAIVLFPSERTADVAKELVYRRKRGGHLLSKGRYLSAQLEAYLAGDLWLG